MSSSKTADSTLAAETARDEARDIPRALNADALTLPAYCFAEIVELVLHDIVDGFARGVDVVAHLIDHVIDRYSVDELAAAIHCGSETALGARTRPAGTFHGALSRPARTFEPAIASPLGSPESRQTSQRGTATGVADQWTDGTPPRWTASEKQCDSGADRGPDKSGRQQVVLLLTILVQFHLWV